MNIIEIVLADGGVYYTDAGNVTLNSDINSHSVYISDALNGFQKVTEKGFYHILRQLRPLVNSETPLDTEEAVETP